jgi:hypothetical protein
MSVVALRRVAPARWVAPVAAGLVASGLGVVFESDALLEAWLFAFVALAGLAAGALGLLMIGHLLGSYWLSPVRDELEAAAVTMPLLAILALPLLLGLDRRGADHHSAAGPSGREATAQP